MKTFIAIISCDGDMKRTIVTANSKAEAKRNIEKSGWKISSINEKEN